MNPLGKIVVSGIAALMLVGGSVPFSAAAKTDQKQISCKASTEAGKNPEYQEISCLLSAAAFEYGVPPEIVKAVATTENGGWEQFNSNGDAVISSDGGIGLMQITNYDSKDEKRLKEDILFNIETGVKMLAYNFYNRTDLPTINDGKNSPMILEHWYFAVMAYNGTKPVNSPTVQATGKRNEDAYQEKVFDKIESEKFQGIDTLVESLPFATKDFEYDPTKTDNIKFNTMNFKVDISLTESTYVWETNDYVVSNFETRLRSTKSTSGAYTTINNNQLMRIKENFKHDAVESSTNQFVWYPMTSLDGQSGYATNKYFEYAGTRLEGAGRYKTAVEVSIEGWNKAETVVIATGENFADALAGVPLAVKQNAPLLLTKTNELPSETKNEIKRLEAKNVIILGSGAAVSTEVEKELKRIVASVKRIGGKDRYDTAAKIMTALGGSPTQAVIAYGGNFPDALSIASYAGRKGIPILLTDTKKLPSSTKNALKGLKSSIVVGSTAVIDTSVVKELPNPTRYGGSDRYKTNSMIIDELNLPTEHVYVATGTNFPDALAGAVLAGKEGAPIVLVDNNVKSSTTTLLKGNLEEFTLLGGKTVVPERIAEQLME